jgi:type IV pilus assembly protein PilC
LLGGLLHQAAVARWARTLATLTRAGVPLLEAMQVTGHAAGHVVLVEASQAIAEAINHGSSLSEAMRKTQAFPDVVVHMCALGEESGTLDTMLAKSAAMLEGDVDQAVAGLSSTLEPLMILVLGVVIGAILLAMYLPIFQLGRVI